MSIINDALKKARREGQSNPLVDKEDTVIQPRRRVKTKPRIIHLATAGIVLFAFFAGVGGIGYVAFQKWGNQQSENEPTPSVSTQPIVTISPSPDETLKTPAKTERETIITEAPLTPELDDREVPPTIATPSTSYAAPDLSDFVINGVMRGGSSVRVLTNSGVYRVGDMLKSPRGFVLKEIGETNVTLQSPSGDLVKVPLP